MTSLKSLVKKIIFTLAITAFAAQSFAAGYIADSDISNSAGSNEGKDQLGMYIFIVLLLVLSVVVGYREKKGA